MDHSLPKSDGYAIRAKYLLEAQARAGHEVTVLTSPSQGAGATDTQISGVNYHRSHYTMAQSLIRALGGKQLVFGRVITRHLARICAGSCFDVIHAHTPFTVALAALHVARRFELPLVYEKRNLWEESARTRGKWSGRWPLLQIARAVDRRTTRRATAVCTITNALRDRVLKQGISPSRVFVVGNGVDIAAFSPRPAPAELRERCAAGGNFVIGFIGSFFSFEGLPLLINAFAGLHARYPAVRLVLVGDGEDRAKVEQLVVERELVECVWLAGRVPHAKVVEFYAAMDVLVYPRYRTMLTEMISPLKPLEAMAMGRCVIGSDVGGIKELIRNQETGLLFQAGSASDLEAKLASVLNGTISASKTGAAARKDVEATRQWSQMAAGYDLAYQYALSQKVVK